MTLFKKKVPIGQLKIRELYKTPREQIFSLQKRFDSLQDIDINLTTHLGELDLNAWSEINKIESILGNLKKSMDQINQDISFIGNNQEFFISELNLTAKNEDLLRFSDDLERIKPFNFITIKQFQKLLKDMIN